MRCLVTGAAGFIGSSLSDRLLKDGHQVRGIDCFVDYYPRQLKELNLKDASQSAAFEFIEADLVKCDMAALLEGVDWVFHQAAQAGVRASWGSYFDSYVHNNIRATQLLLESAQKSSTLKKIVFASSSSVYGNAEKLPTAETVVPAPVSPYGVTKLASEHLMTLYASQSGVPTVSLRYFTVFGPRQRPDMAFPRFIRAALKGEEIVVYGDGEQARDFTFISDIIDANLLAAEHGHPGDVINIGGGPHATVNEVLDILRSELGELRVNRTERQRGDARHTCADISFARERLGFEPKVGLREGLRLEIDWCKSL